MSAKFADYPATGGMLTGQIPVPSGTQSKPYRNWVLLGLGMMESVNVCLLLRMRPGVSSRISPRSGRIGQTLWGGSMTPSAKRHRGTGPKSVSKSFADDTFLSDLVYCHYSIESAYLQINIYFI